ncbi:chorismate synthase [Rhabdochlamydiaceae symbiont of Dictyostelium giganteum]|uniref:chorismate synthase n=1 Tax=Rhabdochlamydiaceae symbiont of Dictyostelium giganteum TaxID=3342349 RepID=UPI00384FE62A
MASNGFGTVFRITTWGESHGPAIGVVIDGCPAGVSLSQEDLILDLKRRAPGQNDLVTPRKEEDIPEILSGVFEGKTTGTPISILIRNKNHDPKEYAALEHLYRPGHAGFTYFSKYGIYDHRGGGRASGRETACRVAAGAIARKLLEMEGISCHAHLLQMGDIKASGEFSLERRNRSLVNCSDVEASHAMIELIEQLKTEGDSIGGVVGFIIQGVPVGAGDPVYEKIEAKLASGMLSIPATKGFEMGEGFYASCLKGSEHNDPFMIEQDQVVTETNHSGGTLGGITTGASLWGKVAFKPASSIKKLQRTVSTEKEPLSYTLASTARHDPCIAIRAVAVVEAMALLVLADAILMNRFAKV